MDYCEHFKGKKITVMGLGVLGRGVGDAALLAECGAELIVTDLKPASELQDSLDALKDFSNITYRLGEHKEEDFKGRDMILKASGVPTDSPYLQAAREDGAKAVMSAALFAGISDVPVIGVTGTRGKSTVTHMIHHVLTHATEGGSVLLGGNVRGVSNLQLLKEVTEDSIAVMELDSWQLQGFGEQRISPQIAVFTNFMPDHMDYYKGDMDKYFADKAQIFLHQDEGDVLVTTPDVFEQAQSFAKGRKITIGQEVVLADASVLSEDMLLSMPGEHNRLNAALAYEALRATSLPAEVILEFLPTFPGVPGRLEFVRDINGVKVYNDNNATTPSATIAGLDALAAQETDIVLLIGGSDKGMELDALVDKIAECCKHVVLYSGTGTEQLKHALNERVPSEEHDTFAEAVKAAVGRADEGDILLFSPAFASFGKEFRNEYDRNDQFVALVEEFSVSEQET